LPQFGNPDAALMPKPNHFASQMRLPEIPIGISGSRNILTESKTATYFGIGRMINAFSANVASPDLPLILY
jgi:hypothetical protein